MGYYVQKQYERSGNIMQYKSIVSVASNTRVALWQIPYNSHYKDYDEDGTRWFESKNQNGSDEIKAAENGLGVSLSQYKIETTKVRYNDNTYDIVSKYKNNTVTEKHGENCVFVEIKDESDRIVAEKVFGFDDSEGRKTIFKHYKKDKDVFTVVQSYSFDTTKNRATDIVNFGYTSDVTTLTKGCNLKKEYYMLNGKQVDVEKTDNGGYIVKNKDGKILTFQVE